MPLNAGAAFALFVLLAGVGPAVAQPPARQEVPVFHAGVQVVAVPVFVTDKNGRSVSGLTAVDFEVLDQGRRVSVVAFQAVDAGGAALAPAMAGPVVQAAASRQFLLLFDLTFSAPSGIMKARNAALEFVRTALAPSDLVAAATFGQSGVRVLVGFTSDRVQLGRAIEGLGLVDTQRQRDPLNLAWDLGVLDAATPGGPGSGGAPAARRESADDLLAQSRMITRSERALYRQRVDGFLGGLEQLGRMLDGVRGRKQVILLSAGFDPTVLSGEQGADRQQSMDAIVEGRLWDVQSDRYFGDAGSRQALEKLYQTLAASDTVIHSVDVAGMVAGGDMDTPLPVLAGQGRDTLAQFAGNTGGRFVKDANDLGAGLREVLDATRYYYVLAFEPSDAGRKKGQQRKLQVRVKGAGLTVSHRAGYLLPDAEKEKDPVNRQLQAAESIAKGLSGGAISLRAIAVPYRSTTGRTLLPVVLELDGVTLLAGVSGKELKLEVYGYALDGEGHISDVLAVSPTFDLGGRGESLRSKGAQLLTTFAVPEGPVDLRFFVRDSGSGRAGSLRLLTTVPNFAGHTLVLSPPLFTEDPRTRVVLPAASHGHQALEIPFRLAEAPFTVDALPTLARGAGREVCVMAWSGAQQGSTSPYEVSVELLGAMSARPIRLDGAPRIVSDADGFQRFVFTLDPGAAEPGEYTLRVSFRDPGTGTVTPTETRLAVR